MAHPLAWVDRATNEPPRPPVSEAALANRRAKVEHRADRATKPTRRQRMAAMRDVIPGATRSMLGRQW